MMKEELDKRLLETLEYGEIHYFRDWSNNILPKICAGVYTIWKDEQLIYVGMSRRSLSAEIIREHKTTGSKAKGLFNRLKSHASGRRSGDQFCVYVADRLVLPTLTRKQIEAIASKELNFDNLIREYIHTYLFYRFVETENDKGAFQLENAIKLGALKAGKPYLNPSN
jgi:hypothetical protein